MNPLFISFDGIDGCGKSTQLKLLAGHLQGLGCRVAVTRDPGGTAIGEKIREIILDPAHRSMSARSEVLLYEASRAQLVEEIIRPALEQGRTVLCDRFFDATFAYQGAGRRLEISAVDYLNRFAAAGLAPDLTFILDLPVEVSAHRLAASGKRPDRLEGEGREFHQRVRDNYLALARQNPERILLIEGNRPAEAIFQEIVPVVEKKLQAELIRRGTS